ncbi:MAG TPA: hypothetical protein V6D06_14410 [Trichocoleus sp.]
MPDIEILRTGKVVSANGVEVDLTAERLQEVVDTYNAETFKAPLIVSHNTGGRGDADLAETELAYGFPDRLKMVGDRVKAQFSKIAPKFVQWVREGQLMGISPSLYTPTSPANPYPGKWALRHIAGLGTNPPAIKGLAPLSLQELAAADGDWALDFDEFGVDAGEAGTLDFAFGITSIERIIRSLRDWLIESQGREVADQIVPDEAIAALRYDDPTEMLMRQIDELRAVVYEKPPGHQFNFAAPKTKAKQCKKGFPCGNSCISKTRNCLKPLEGQHKTAAEWLKKNTKKSGKAKTKGAAKPAAEKPTAPDLTVDDVLKRTPLGAYRLEIPAENLKSFEGTLIGERLSGLNGAYSKDEGAKARTAAENLLRRYDHARKVQPLEDLGAAARHRTGPAISSFDDFKSVLQGVRADLIGNNLGPDNIINTAVIRQAMGTRLGRKQFDDFMWQASKEGVIDLIGDAKEPRDQLSRSDFVRQRIGNNPKSGAVWRAAPANLNEHGNAIADQEAREAANMDELNQIKAERAALEAELKAARLDSIVQFCENYADRLTPAMGQKQTLDFGEGNTAEMDVVDFMASLDGKQLAFFKGLVKLMPSQVEFQELGKEGTDPGNPLNLQEKIDAARAAIASAYENAGGEK